MVLLSLVLVLIIFAAITAAVVYNDKRAVIDETREVFTNKEGEAPYTDLEGNPISLDQYLGKILVVTSWASWSPFSKDDLENMTELSAVYAEKDVVFMAINRKETKEQAARYLQTQPTFTNLVMVLDPRDYFYNAIGGYAMPELVVYNRRGEIINHFRGPATQSEVESVINELLSSKE